jgi:hypothetical protein
VALIAERPNLERDHIVQFYEHEDELIHRVSRYLGAALATGGSAIIVATEEHRCSIEERLGRLGLDVAEAWSSGALLIQDAHEAMDALLGKTKGPDPGEFDRLIGSLARYAARNGEPIRAFGEVVALMVEAGHVEAALELERLWNDLQRQVPFALYCAYPQAAVAAARTIDLTDRICELHSRLVPSTHPTPPPGPGSLRAPCG